MNKVVKHPKKKKSNSVQLSSDSVFKEAKRIALEKEESIQDYITSAVDKENKRYQR